MAIGCKVSYVTLKICTTQTRAGKNFYLPYLGYLVSLYLNPQQHPMNAKFLIALALAGKPKARAAAGTTVRSPWGEVVGMGIPRGGLFMGRSGPFRQPSFYHAVGLPVPDLRSNCKNLCYKNHGW